MAQRVLSYWPHLVALLFGITTAWALFEPGFFASHDGPVHVMRQAIYHQSLLEGQMPPRWGSNLLYGYGYPLFIFLYPLPLMLGELLVILGIAVPSVVEIVFAIALIAGCLGMYLFGRRLYGTLGGLVVVAVYSFFPYRAVEVYVRGSIGEIVALALFPWLLFTLQCFGTTRKRKFWAASSVAICFLILSHNILAMLLLPIALAYLGLLWLQKRQSLLLYASVFATGIGLASWFWVPALWEKHYTVLDQAIAANFNYRDYFVTPVQLFLYSPWGFGGSKPGPIDGMSFLIPKEFLALFLACLGALVFAWVKKKEEVSSLWFWVATAIVAAFMTLTWSRPIWDIVKPLALIQYPWRLLAVVMIALSITSGAVTYFLGRWAGWVTAVVVVILFARNIGYFRTGPESPLDGVKLITPERVARSTTTYADEHLPIWVEHKPREAPVRKIEVISGSGESSGIIDKGVEIRGEVNLLSDSSVRINTFFFPGWTVWVDNQKVNVEQGRPFGTMDFAVPAGKHTIKVALSRTGDQMLGMVLTAASVLLFALVWKKYPRLLKP